MKNWDDVVAKAYSEELDQLTYAAHLISQEARAGMCGCVASLKGTIKNLLCEEEEIIYVDNANRFAPLRYQRLARLAGAASLSKSQLENELACSRVDSANPAPSQDSFVHVVLPYRIILFAQPEAVLSLACSTQGLERMRMLLGERVPVLSYAPAGFALAKACQQAVEKQGAANIEGIYIDHQGLLVFGETARMAYERLVEIETAVEKTLREQDAWELSFPVGETTGKSIGHELAALRKSVSNVAGFPLILTHFMDEELAGLCAGGMLDRLAQGLPVAGDAGILKVLPMVGRDVEAYREALKHLAGEYESADVENMPDSAPRTVLDTEFGLCSLGRTAAQALLAQKRFLQVRDIVLRAGALGG